MSYFADIMVDIETLGTEQNSVITQIGAVYFDKHTGELGEEFLINVNIQDCLDRGLKVDSGALKFWFKEAFARGVPTFLKETVGLCAALSLLRRFNDEKAEVWSHSTFDMGRLADAYSIIGEKLCFSYRKVRDIRTLTSLANTKQKSWKVAKELKTHDALDDCKRQVRYCVECFNILKGKGN